MASSKGNTGKEKTPYQGKNQVYGIFRCWNRKCREKWESPNSWANLKMDCPYCDTASYPFKQIPLPKTNLTPLQGGEDERYFGYFKCPKCKRKWKSGYSWANMGQECKNKKCKESKTNVYPYDQVELELSDGANTKPHLMALCQKCKETGRNCQEKRNENRTVRNYR